jgi:hypothetical protein
MKARGKRRAGKSRSRPSHHAYAQCVGVGGKCEWEEEREGEPVSEYRVVGSEKVAGDGADTSQGWEIYLRKFIDRAIRTKGAWAQKKRRQIQLREIPICVR